MLSCLVNGGIKYLFSVSSFRVWQRDFDVWKKKYMASLTGNLGEPILFLLAMGFGLGSMIPSMEGTRYIEFIAPGLIGSAIMYGASFECTFGSYTRIAVQKTYDAIRVTPVSLEEVTAGDMLWGATRGLIGGMVFLGVMLCFGLIKSWGAFFLPFVMILISLVFASLAMFFSSKAPSYDFFSYYFTLIIAPMFLFSGIFFPLETMPFWVKGLAWLMPLTHFVDLSRALVLGDIGWWALVDVLWLLLFTVITVYFAIQGVRKRVIN